MENQTLVVLDGNQVDIEVLEHEVADAVVGPTVQSGAYAKALNLCSLRLDWFMFEASDTSDDAKTVKVRKDALYAKLKAAEHTNPSTVWARIRKYGQEERVLASLRTKAKAKARGSTQRDVTTRNVEELIKLYKFNSKQDSLPAKVREANDAIVMALKCLGVDVSMVK
jgi:hypothetical protein